MASQEVAPLLDATGAPAVGGAPPAGARGRFRGGGGAADERGGGGEGARGGGEGGHPGPLRHLWRLGGAALRPGPGGGGAGPARGGSGAALCAGAGRG